MGPSQISPSPGTCPGCQRMLGPGAREGLCTACLLGSALVLASQADDDAAELISASGLEGRTLGGYEILSTVAQGGMGVVFRARQRNPQRVVALKVISAGELATRRMVERFHNEAVAAARLDHPNIVPIYEVGEDRGWHFFSMQLIAGRTLADLIRQQRPDPAAAVALLVKIARAVEHAHQRGILHRDLKPTNILLDEQGGPHLTDFGLAKVAEQESDLTLTHAVLGTPAYMSPEQAAGKSRDITTATDVYGLGAIFYELLAGRPPFTADGTPALLRKIAEEEPGRISNSEFQIPNEGGSNAESVNRKSKIVNRVPLDLEMVCLKCLEKDPARRYATAGELADELERWQRHEPVLARPASTFERTAKWVRRHRMQAALGTTVVVAGFVLTVVSLLYNIRLDRAKDAAEQNAARNRDQLVREHLREAGRRTESGDGLTALFPLVEALRLEEPGGVMSESIRRRVGLTLRSSPELLRLWDAGGGPYRIGFSSDNRRVTVAMRDGGIRVCDLVDGSVQSIVLGKGEKSYGVVISPDGMLAAESISVAPFIRIRQLDRGGVATVAADRPFAGSVSFSGTGRWLIAGGDRLRFWDMKTFREVQIDTPTAGDWIRTISSPDDRLVLAVARDGTARLLETGTWRWRETTDPIFTPDTPMPAFSNDGRWLAVFAEAEMALFDTENGLRKFAVPHSAIAFNPAFSPDGRYVALPSFRDQVRVWALPSENTGTNVTAYRLPVRHETGANQALFSPDGRLLATAGFDYQLRLLHAGRHQAVAPALHHTALVEAMAFSGDGRFLASADARGLVRVWDLQPRGLSALPGLAARPAPMFTADGDRIIARDSSDALRIWDAASGKPAGEPLYEPQEGSDGTAAPVGLAWDVSGRYLAAAAGSQGVRVWEFETRRLVAAWTNVGVVMSVAFDPAGKVLAAGTSAGEVRRWRFSDHTELPAFQGEVAPARSVAWSGTGRWLAVGGERAAQLFDTASGKTLGGPLPVPDTLAAISFTRDGQRLLTAGGNDAITPGAAVLWELPSMERRLPPMEHGDGIATAAFSSDGELVATGGEDNVVRLWSANSCAPIGRAMRQDTVAAALHFDRTSRWLAVANYDGSLRVWSMPGGELGGPPLALAPRLPAATFSPDGDRILAAGLRSGWLVSFAPEVRTIEEMARIARGQTALQSGRDGVPGQVPLETLAGEFSAHLPSGDRFVAPEQAAGWHEGHAATAETEGSWFTAAFHLRRLSDLRPDDESVRHRLANAIRNLK